MAWLQTCSLCSGYLRQRKRPLLLCQVESSLNTWHTMGAYLPCTPCPSSVTLSWIITKQWMTCLKPLWVTSPLFTLGTEMPWPQTTLPEAPHWKCWRDLLCTFIPVCTGLPNCFVSSHFFPFVIGMKSKHCGLMALISHPHKMMQSEVIWQGVCG